MRAADDIPPQLSHAAGVRRPPRWFASEAPDLQDGRVAVEKLGAPIAIRRPETRAPVDAAQHFARGLTRVLAAERPARWEFAVAIAGIFLLARYPLLFAQRRLASVFGLSSVPLWQDDPLIYSALLLTAATMVVLAIRSARARSVARQPMLLAVLLICWSSIAWSVHPSLSARRALLFIAAAGAGWYLGDRFSLRDQLTSLAGVTALGIVLSVGAFLVWPDLALATNRAFGAWSGIYVNRNHFALVLSYGALATGILLFGARPRWRLPLIALLAVDLGLLWGTGSRTGPVALAVAVGVVALVAAVRPWGVRLLKGWAGAVACTGVIVMIGGFVQWYWTTIVGVLGRQPRLTGRTALWEATRWFSRLRPWEGWGFEAVWTREREAFQILVNFGKYPYTAHNGYYEFLLGMGRIGLGLLLMFLVVLTWRAFRYAWTRRDALSLWPLALVTFVVVVNFSESLFFSGVALWTLTVAAAVTVAATRPTTA
jgi:exopolysaccharide production protein ExoQ